MAAPFASRTVSIIKNVVFQHSKHPNVLATFLAPSYKNMSLWLPPLKTFGYLSGVNTEKDPMENYGTPKVKQCPVPVQSTYSASTQQTRGSRYSPLYLDPILTKEELQQGLEENDVRNHHPIKAPSTDYSLSPLFYDPEVQKFTNLMMMGGNKETVRTIMRKLFENLKHAQVERYNKATTDKERSEIVCDPMIIFKQAIENCKPLLMTKRVVKGGVAYRVPVAARPQEQRFRSMKWLIESCRDDRKLPMEKKLAWEILDAFGNQGRAIRKKQEMHRICESNRAYAHLRP